jgi:hypothetical protein
VQFAAFLIWRLDWIAGWLCKLSQVDLATVIFLPIALL